MLKAYELKDIPVIDIPNPVIEYAKEVATLLDKENQGKKTMDGGKNKNIKGTIAQWAVHKYLEDNGWYHEYSKPYTKEQHGDKYDILFAGEEVWDVKCRDWWNEEYFYNHRILMGEHEFDSFCEKPCDYYIFTTLEKDLSKAYILGGLVGYDLWDKLQELKESEKTHMKYPTKGKTYSRYLTPIRDLILRV